MYTTTCVFNLSLFFLFSFVNGNSPLSKELNTTETCAHLYEKGVEAYLENDYSNCVLYFENALKKYRAYAKRIQNCRIKCRDEAENSEPLFPIDIDNLLFFERAVKATLCIVNCKTKNKIIMENIDINRETEHVFETKKPYEYLHICYFQTGNPQYAASAAFTYLSSHPEDKIMSANLKYYTAMEGVDSKKIINFEAKDYVYLYAHGVDAYEKQDWKTVANYMEESILSYLQSDNECRAQCEGEFDHGWYPDFIPSIANHFTFSLKCKRLCSDRLNLLNGAYHDDLLPSHYHYLQFAYFKIKKLKHACEAVASYLFFYPDDETMLTNMKYYKTLPKVQDHFFTPRPEAVKYVQRQIYEDRLLKFILKEFNGPVPDATREDLSRRMRTIWKFKEEKRQVFDGLATKKECNNLLKIAKIFAEVGDGYEGKISPHTKLEKFEGLSLERFMFLARIGLVNRKYLEQYLDLGERVRNNIQDYFKLEKELYFSFTHLVCRSALPDSPKNRTDLSHEIHADNCRILPSGSCDKAPPAFTWRDYSAILYLNGDFEGGEFIFSGDPEGKHLQAIIKPKCGRMVAFSAGKENLHGVKAVINGTRCAVGLWFTFDPNKKEKERDLALKAINRSKMI